MEEVHTNTHEERYIEREREKTFSRINTKRGDVYRICCHEEEALSGILHRAMKSPTKRGKVTPKLRSKNEDGVEQWWFYRRMK